MTNKTFKVMIAHARPYQGFPYVNPPVHDAPSIPIQNQTRPEQPSRPSTLEPNELQPEDEVATTRIVESNIERERIQQSTDKERGVSRAERELRQNYGQGSSGLQHQRYIDHTSKYVDETILYDPFENRQIAPPKKSPEAESKPEEAPVELSDSDDDTNSPLPMRTYNDDIYSPSTSSSAALASIRDPMSPGTSYGDVSSSIYYTKESGVYGGTQTDSLPETIPVECFPAPPPAYSEIDLLPRTPKVSLATQAETPPSCGNSVTVQPLPSQVITTPTPTVGRDPATLYNPSRKYITCQFCRQQVLTIIRKESSYFTHSLACFNVCCGLIPCALCVYCTDYFKQSRHYCPNCDLLVGREEVTCSGVVYTET